MSHFKFITPQYIASHTNVREGETKLGEQVTCLQEPGWDALAATPAMFVIVGIPEDIGVIANYGVGGTSGFWEPALKALLNVQETDKIKGADILVSGYFDFSEWRRELDGKPISDWRRRVGDIDDAVFPVIEQIVKSGKIPIVIGGGHNNAYPILKGVSRANEKPVNCVNLDAHSDYRRVEGRHSGNGFRYAKMDGYLKRYVMIGLDENYNSKNVLDDMNADKEINYYFFEDIFLHEHTSFSKVLSKATQFLHKRSTGIELDMDRITGMLSSAATPCGVTPVQARQFIIHMAQSVETAYLHIAEGAIRLDHGRDDPLTPKMAAYLITDFVKAARNKRTV